VLLWARGEEDGFERYTPTRVLQLTDSDPIRKSDRLGKIGPPYGRSRVSDVSGTRAAVVSREPRGRHTHRSRDSTEMDCRPCNPSESGRPLHVQCVDRTNGSQFPVYADVVVAAERAPRGTVIGVDGFHSLSIMERPDAGRMCRNRHLDSSTIVSAHSRGSHSVHHL